MHTRTCAHAHMRTHTHTRTHKTPPKGCSLIPRYNYNICIPILPHKQLKVVYVGLLPMFYLHNNLVRRVMQSRWRETLTQSHPETFTSNLERRPTLVQDTIQLTPMQLKTRTCCSRPDLKPSLHRPPSVQF